LGILTFWVSIRGASTVMMLAAAALACAGAIAYRGNVFSRLAWLITPLWAIAAASWSGPLLGAGFGALLFLLLRNSMRRTCPACWTAAAFFVFVNAFVFSSQIVPRQHAVLVLAAASLVVVIGAHLASFREADGYQQFDTLPMLAVCVVLVMELLLVLRLLPYGYLSLAAIAAAWYFTLFLLYEAYLKGELMRGKIGQEMLAAAVFTALIAASSGMSPK
jgi:hypothetical protein